MQILEMRMRKRASNWWTGDGRYGVLIYNVVVETSKTVRGGQRLYKQLNKKKVIILILLCWPGFV